MSARVLVAACHGCEELETVTIIDTLRRAGASVTLASCNVDGTLLITASRNIQLVADTPLSNCLNTPWQLIVLPGGMPGAEKLRDCPALIALLQQQYTSGLWLAAICAAPAIVLDFHQIAKGAQITCYPEIRSQLHHMNWNDAPVVIDSKHKLITSQGPGTALAFSLQLVKSVCGQHSADTISKQMLA